jgi:rare lipoprotein A
MGIIEHRRLRRTVPVILAAGACVVLANCSASNKLANRVDPKYGVSSSPRVVDFGDPVPKGGGTYRVGKPYTVAGREYVPQEDTRYRAEGMASWYGDDFHGRLTANGEVFDMTSLTAAHPTLPMPSYVRVTNTGNGKSVIVRVNDRGPYHGNRLIDVSHRAATLLGFHGNGVAKVRVEYVGRAPIEGSDDRQLEATLRTGEPAPAPSNVRIASARPFVPELPAAGRPVSGEVPIPEGRPFTLGNTTQDIASAGATSEMSAARSRRSAGRSLDNPREVAGVSTGGAVESAPLPPAAGSRPVAAYAPVRSDDAIGTMLSGRGLY